MLSHLGREDLSRFVHFCTGSSLLPPGGFAGLKPLLQVRQINIFFVGIGVILSLFLPDKLGRWRTGKPADISYMLQHVCTP